MKSLAFVSFLALVMSCGAMSKSRQHAEFAQLEFDVPAEWQHKDTVFKGVSTSIWTPEDNDNHESITVIRSELAPAMAHASDTQLASLLEHAQAFAGAKVSAAAPVTTPSGLSGARVEVDYVPPGQRDRYHRVHVVLIDGTSLVHLLYTAKRVDPQATALSTVFNTIRNGEG